MRNRTMTNRTRTLLPWLLLLAVAGCRSEGDGTAVAELRAESRLAAATADPTGSTERGPEVRLRRVWAGTNPDFYASSISPDGRYMSLNDWSAVDVAVMDLNGGQVHRLTNVQREDQGPWQEPGVSVFSPDGRQVVYSWLIGPDVQLRIVDFDQYAADAPRPAEPAVLFHNPEFSPYYVFDWSPDGRHVVAKVYTGGIIQLALISTIDGTYRALKSLDWREPLRAEFSPDGHHVAYDLPPEPESADRDIYVVSLDGAYEASIVDGPAIDRLLGWDPAGDILFHSDRSGTPGIWRIQMSGGRPAARAELLRADVLGVEPLGFGDRGFYYGVRVNPLRLYTAGVDLETGRAVGRPVPVEHSAHVRIRGSDWSPDGNFLAYSAFTPGAPGSLIVIRSDQGEEVQTLRLDLTVTRRMRWTPDGEALIVHASDGKGRSGFHRLDLRSGSYTTIVRDDQLDQTPATGDFDISPDGKTIYFATSAEGEAGLSLSLVAYGLASGSSRVITPVEWQDRQVPLAYPYTMISVSPDGAKLALAAPDATSGGHWIGTIPVEGGRFTRLAHFENATISPVWTPDGRRIVFSTWTDGTTWIVSADGGEPRPLDLLTEWRILARRGMRLHPEGRSITFFGGDPRGEVWVMERLGERMDAEKEGGDSR